jgi:hypothetical protein
MKIQLVDEFQIFGETPEETAAHSQRAVKRLIRPKSSADVISKKLKERSTLEAS